VGIQSKHLGLGYPELEATDAYKSIMLCDFGLHYDSEIGLKVRLAVDMWLMLEDSEAVCLQISYVNLILIWQSMCQSFWAAVSTAEEAQRRVKSLIEGERLEA
jgi:hypothetical protein